MYFTQTDTTFATAVAAAVAVNITVAQLFAPIATVAVAKKKSRGISTQ